MITYLQAALLMGLLLRKETCRERLFVGRIHKDAPEGMFRLRASVEADAAATGDLFDDREETIELR